MMVTERKLEGHLLQKGAGLHCESCSHLQARKNLHTSKSHQLFKAEQNQNI